MGKVRFLRLPVVVAVRPSLPCSDLFIPRRLFGRFRSLQLLNIATDKCPAWIYACCVLHNLLEASDEPFEDELLEVEPVFPLVAMQQPRPVDADADGDVDMADVVVVAGPVESASARRDRVAKQIWNARHPDNLVV
jgi:hypothetical protein